MDIFLGTLFIVVCILLIIVVLLQKGRGGGLGAAFGGAATSAFGTKTGDVFTWVTIVLTGLFLLLAGINVLVFRQPPVVLPRPELTPTAVEGGWAVSMFVAAKDAQIHYTTDGSEPNASSPAYEKTPIIVKQGQLLKAKAIRRGAKDSLVAVFDGSASQPAEEVAPSAAPMTMPAPATGPAMPSPVKREANK
jgi:preprotein translocase subunit SecG